MNTNKGGDVYKRQALYCCLTDGGALDPQKAAERPVYQHQGVRQPQEAGVHQLIDLIYPEQEAKPLSLRQGKAVADNSADGAPGELRHGETVSYTHLDVYKRQASSPS